MWIYAVQITFYIFQNYTSSHAQIERKNPETLLAEIVDNLTKMFKSKMDAVRVSICFFCFSYKYAFKKNILAIIK